MKRTKLVFAVSSICLSLMAVAATKAKTSAVDGYYTNTVSHHCTVAVAGCTSTSGTQCTTQINGSSQKLYTINTTGACNTLDKVFKPVGVE